MTIKTIFRIVDDFIPMDEFDIPMRLIRDPLDDPEIIDRIENEWRKMYLDEEENWGRVNQGWDEDMPPLENIIFDDAGIVFDDAMPPLVDAEVADFDDELDQWGQIVPNVAWQNPNQGQQLVANIPQVNDPNLFERLYEYDEILCENLFDLVTSSTITDIYKLLGQVGKVPCNGYTHFPCFNCLAYGWNGGDGMNQYRPGRCCKECNDQPYPNHVHEDILHKGTWAWDKNICRNDKYEEEMFFDLIVETMKRAVICDFDFVLEHCGQEDGYTCLKCLQCKNEWWEGCDDCEDFCHDEHTMPSNVLKMGTWAWSQTKSRDENGLRYQFDDDIYETDHRDVGLDDRDYEDDYDY